MPSALRSLKLGIIEDIAREAERRQLDGIINYTQRFCYRQVCGVWRNRVDR